MTIARPGRKVLVLGLISGSLVTWRELKQGHVPPPPHAYTGVMVVFGIDSVIAEFAPDIAVYLGVAWTLAIAYGTAGALHGSGALSFPAGGPKTQTSPTPGSQPRGGRKDQRPRPAQRSTRVRARRLPPPKPHRQPRRPRKRRATRVASRQLAPIVRR